MQASGRVAALTLWCLAAPAAAQQTMTLPEITVTAPSNQPPAIGPTSQSAPGMPYFGNVRVEEAKWPEISCAASRVGAATGTCRRGPPQMTFERGDANGGRQMGNCQIAHDLVMSQLGALQFEADSLVFDPYYISGIGHQRQDCYVEALPARLEAQFLDMNQMTRPGSGWRNFIANGDLTTMEFTLGRDNCLALEKRWPRWGGGFIWLVHASICRQDGRPVDAANVETVLATIKVQQHDPNGNLRQ